MNAVVVLTLVCALLGVSSGCAQRNLPDGPTGTVSGQVLSEGKPIPEKSSIVMIHSGSSLPAGAEIGANGEFVPMMKGTTTLLAGTYTVAVMPPPEPTPSPSENSTPSKVDKYPEIPKVYRSLDTTPLKLEVKPGKNQLTVSLDPVTTK